MKRGFLALGLCLLLFGVAEAQSNRIRVGDAFRGPVRSARIERAEIFLENGEYKEGPRVLSTTVSYAPDWSWSENVGYKSDGTIIQKIKTTYDPSGAQTSISKFDSDGKLMFKIVYIYKDGKIVEEDRFNGDGSLEQRRITVQTDKGQGEVQYYDGSGALIKKQTTTRDGQRTITTTYNASGARVEAMVQYPGSGIPRTEITRYRANGTVLDNYVGQSDNATGRIDKTSSAPDGTLLRKTSEKREYDSNNNLSKITNYAWDEAAGKFQPVSVSYYSITYAETK